MKSRDENLVVRGSISARKKAGFYGLAVLLPVVVLGLLEIALRLFGFGASYPLFIDAGGPVDFRVQNGQVARRYFPGFESVPQSSPDFFLSKKPKNGVRIFVQGGSSAAGFPYYYGGAFSRMLETALRSVLPDREVEVINTALAAVNSYTLLDLADEIVAEQPDFVLIYAGHNEYYGALGVGSAVRVSFPRRLKVLYLSLARLRIVQFIRRSLGLVRFERSRPIDRDATLMEALAADPDIPLGSDKYRRGIRQFSSNLDCLLGLYQSHGIPVFVGTLVANERDQAPFVGGFDRLDGQGRALYRRAVGLAAEGRLASALTTVDTLIGRHGNLADAHFVRARILEAGGQHVEARKAYLSAKDADALRFRAPEEVNTVIRRLALERGAEVVDVQEAFSKRSLRGIVGHSLITEHLHPNLIGYRVMAEAYLEALCRSLGCDPGDAVFTPTYTIVDSLSGEYRIRSLTGGWPFRPEGTSNRVLDTMQVDSASERIALSFVRGTTNWEEATEELLQHMATVGDEGEVQRTARALAENFPFNPTPHLILGHMFFRSGRFEKALQAFERSRSLASSADADRMIGFALLQLGRPAQAVPFLERAVDSLRASEELLLRLATAYLLAGHTEQAAVTAKHLLDLHPDHPGAEGILQATTDG